MNSPIERDTIITYFAILKERDEKYVSLGDYRTGLKYEILEDPKLDKESGMATAVFRGHVFFCPDIPEDLPLKNDPNLH
jgi:hypothetical protein